MAMGPERDKDMLDYAKRAGKHQKLFPHDRYVPPGSTLLPEEVPKAKTIPAFKKGGKVAGGKGGQKSFRR